MWRFFSPVVRQSSEGVSTPDPGCCPWPPSRPERSRWDCGCPDAHPTWWEGPPSPCGCCPPHSLPSPWLRGSSGSAIRSLEPRSRWAAPCSRRVPHGREWVRPCWRRRPPWVLQPWPCGTRRGIWRRGPASAHPPDPSSRCSVRARWRPPPGGPPCSYPCSGVEQGPLESSRACPSSTPCSAVRSGCCCSAWFTLRGPPNRPRSCACAHRVRACCSPAHGWGCSSVSSSPARNSAPTPPCSPPSASPQP